MPFYLLIVVILVLGCVWIWGAHEAEQWLESREKNPYIRVAVAAYMGLFWWLITLAKVWWRSQVQEAEVLWGSLNQKAVKTPPKEEGHIRRLLRDERGSLMVWGCGVVLLMLVLATLFFIWYLNTGLPRTYPTDHDTFIWGILHGMFIFPDLIISFFSTHHVTIYQTPNSGNGYNIGFMIGIWAIYGGSGSAVSAGVGSRFIRD